MDASEIIGIILGSSVLATLATAVFNWLGKRQESKVQEAGTVINGYDKLTADLTSEIGRLEKRIEKLEDARKADKAAFEAERQALMKRIEELLTELQRKEKENRCLRDDNAKLRETLKALQAQLAAYEREAANG